MRRERRSPRPDWTQRMENIGFSFHSMGGIYWDENACYHFTEHQIDTLESATQELHGMCRQAVEHMVRNDWFERLRIPREFAELVQRSWSHNEFSLYGRFDLVYDGKHPPKLLEYNADTPTALFEASVAQWYWLQDVDPVADQFNSIHEKLIACWQTLAAQLPPAGDVHFACLDEHVEDYITCEYLRDTANQAGLATVPLAMQDIGADDRRRCFVGLQQRPITTLFKLYPWEWLIRDEFGPRLLTHYCRILEPAWKMLLSNKGILPILWELFPRHPNLLPAYFEPSRLGSRYVSKPFFSREGANVSLVSDNQAFTAEGNYGQEGLIYQAYYPLPVFEGNHTVVGSWIIGEQAAGIGIREDNSPITQNTSRFIPHYFT